jgi:hypothetical protein
MKKHKHTFTNKNALAALIQTYFDQIEGQYHLEKVPAKKPADPADLVEQKVWDRDPEPATIAGLAFFLGFNSRDEFEEYESSGKFATVIKRARLRIEADYEKKLHYQSSTGAIFALKSLGWNEKAEKPAENEQAKPIKIKIIESGHPPASTEKDVIL